jgi:hypothetical protein
VIAPGRHHPRGRQRVNYGSLISLPGAGYYQLLDRYRLTGTAIVPINAFGSEGTVGVIAA